MNHLDPGLVFDSHVDQTIINLTGCEIVPQFIPSDEQTQLTPVQERAIEFLLLGRSINQTAAELGIDRTTLHRWRTNDLEFCRKFNEQRQELQAIVRERLVGLTTKAVDSLESALDKKDAKTALALLKGLGYLSDDPKVTVNVNAELPSRKPITLHEQREELVLLLKEASTLLTAEEIQELLESNPPSPASKIHIPVIVCEDD